jgi:hypothetical protein
MQNLAALPHRVRLNDSLDCTALFLPFEVPERKQ